MQKFLSKYSKSIVVLFITVISVILLFTAVSMLAQYSDEVSDRAASKAQYLTQSSTQIVSDHLGDYTTKAVALAVMLSDCQTQEDVYHVFQSLTQKSEYKDIRRVRYFVGDTLHDEYGGVYEGPDAARSFRATSPDRSGYIGTFEDTAEVDGNMSLIGFYAPVSDSDLVDAVVIYYTRNKVESFFPKSEETPEAEFSVLVANNEKHEIIVGSERVENADIKDALRLRIGEAAPVEEVMRLITSGTDGIVRAKILGRDYLVSVGADKSRLQDLAVVELYSVDVLCASSFDFVNTIIMIVILFALITLFAILYLVVRRIRREREFFNLETTDTKLECPNRNGFEKEIRKILDRNKTSYFAVIVANLRHYKHIYEAFGEGETSHLLMHLRLACSKTVGIEETFGHNGEGQFLLLLHAKDRTGLIERLKMHSYLATQYKGAHKFDILMKYGIYEVNQDENITVTQMIDFANEANNAITQATVQNTSMQFNFYNDNLRKIRLINDDMELRMEGALRDGEFQVFYQPKYNLNLGRQDGCEALVRWYDPKTKNFNPPALFMQLFETNGFIVKLDKYVYTKVCEYISYTIAHGGTVYPVSVNVSRITAVQPDFIDYYWKTKRKYGIADSQIMIEFTEGFAYENYETLRTIVDGLHEKGFKCSIDDFGCGYSSYRILKSLPMDEIKLDKFFLEKSDSEQRDLAIFKSIIQLAKSLGMKVTQEGVELKEDLLRLIDLGCDVIQGYYYSHPLSLSDYISFVSSSRDHNIT